ncbi:hypothetical protein E2C01_101932 [Portunus trituberculatus]|uniref:Uncharacterized protein n=1 Tax=Portunus trituberculatus TaxID=210409 RepID=A0A5B7K6U3_PORTR|nr:hypothetical protein [Portunus trituberculatus]
MARLEALTISAARHLAMQRSSVSACVSGRSGLSALLDVPPHDAHCYTPSYTGGHLRHARTPRE